MQLFFTWDDDSARDEGPSTALQHTIMRESLREQLPRRMRVLRLCRVSQALDATAKRRHAEKQANDALPPQTGKLGGQPRVASALTRTCAAVANLTMANVLVAGRLSHGLLPHKSEHQRQLGDHSWRFRWPDRVSFASGRRNYAFTDDHQFQKSFGDGDQAVPNRFHLIPPHAEGSPQPPSQCRSSRPRQLGSASSFDDGSQPH